MTIIETAVIFGIIPLATVAAITALVFMGSPRPTARYRPGQQLSFQPVWFLANPDSPLAHAEAVEGSSQKVLEPPSGQGVLDAGEHDSTVGGPAADSPHGSAVAPATTGDTVVLGETGLEIGGTRGTW